MAGDDKVAILRTTDKKEKDTVFDGWMQFEM